MESFSSGDARAYCENVPSQSRLSEQPHGSPGWWPAFLSTPGGLIEECSPQARWPQCNCGVMDFGAQLLGSSLVS